MAALAYFITTLRERFEDKERGATAVEYGLIVALIAVFIIVALQAVGGGLSAVFNDIAGELNGVVGGGGGGEG